MNHNELSLRNKLLIGINLSYSRLIEQKQKEDGNLIFSKDGKIVKIKARKMASLQESPTASR